MSVPIDASRLDHAYQTALAALLAERTSRRLLGRRIVHLRLVHRHRRQRPGSRPEGDRRHGSFMPLIDGGVALARVPSEHRRRMGRYGQEFQQHLDHDALSRRVPSHLRPPTDTPMNLPRPSMAGGTLRQDAGRIGRGRPRSLRQGSHFLGADSDDERPGRAGRVEGSAVAAVRVGVLSAVVVIASCVYPVVSYALPALIAIGQAVYHHRPPWNPLARLVRRMAIDKSLRVLQAIQPSSGGYLEAAPLTSFVTMGLASIGLADHPVVGKAVEFLVNRCGRTAAGRLTRTWRRG